MKTIVSTNGGLDIPKEAMHIKTPWCTIVYGKWNKFNQRSERRYYRHKETGQSPYIPEGFVELDKITYKVIDK